MTIFEHISMILKLLREKILFLGLFNKTGVWTTNSHRTIDQAGTKVTEYYLVVKW